MKRLSISLVILAIVIGIGITGFIINTNTAKSVIEKVNTSKKYALENNIEQAKKELALAIDEWEENMETMLLFVSHGKLDQIEEAITIAYSYLEHDEMSLFYAECQRAATLINHFENVEYPNINNIF